MRTLAGLLEPPRAVGRAPQEVSRLENTRENSRKLRSEPVGPREPLDPRDGCSQSLWNLTMAAPGATAASRWLLPEPLERRDSCSESLWGVEMAVPTALEPRGSCSQSLWSIEIAGQSAFGASQWLLPEPLELPGGCSQSLWSLKMVAASRKLSRRLSKKLRSSSKTPSSKALCD